MLYSSMEEVWGGLRPSQMALATDPCGVLATALLTGFGHSLTPTRMWNPPRSFWRAVSTLSMHCLLVPTARGGPKTLQSIPSTWMGGLSQRCCRGKLTYPWEFTMFTFPQPPSPTRPSTDRAGPVELLLRTRRTSQVPVPTR